MFSFLQERTTTKSKKTDAADLIDLTMIPPPATPDEEGPPPIPPHLGAVAANPTFRVLPGAASAVSTPPTPFADRQTLEAELRALDQAEAKWGKKAPGKIICI